MDQERVRAAHNPTIPIWSAALTSDDALFETVLRNSHHVLHDLLPKETDSCYDFRHRRHNRLLINKTSHLADSDFIIRMIYKDMY